MGASESENFLLIQLFDQTTKEMAKPLFIVLCCGYSMVKETGITNISEKLLAASFKVKVTDV
jgi:hypothetical protein